MPVTYRIAGGSISGYFFVPIWRFLSFFGGCSTVE